MRTRTFHRGVAPRVIFKLFMGVFAVIGLAMLVGTVVMFQSTAVFLAGAERAQGVVIDLHYQRSYDGGTYYPVVRFRGPEGQDVVFRTTAAK